jgi:predicted O-methyltransferase YrrM
MPFPTVTPNPHQASRVSAVRERVKQLLQRAVRTAPGKHAIHAALRGETVAEYFRQVSVWPETMGGFEDLAFLFTSSQLNHGVASLRFDEAALLFRTTRGLGPATVAEIGRFKGGSTLVMAAALAEGSTLLSYDLHVPGASTLPGVDLDRELQQALTRYGLGEGVQLIVGDSRTVELPATALDLLFIDGDHSYEGTRADFLRWSPLLRDGGHLLFHDAVDTGGYGNVYPGVSRAIEEVERSEQFRRHEGAGTIAHFTRRGVVP